MTFRKSRRKPSWATWMGRNPATGEAIKIKAKVAYRPAKELKEAV